MKKVKLGLAELNIPEKGKLGRAIATALGKNATTFPNPTPTPDQLVAHADAMDAAAAKAAELRNDSQAGTIAQDKAEDILDAAITQAASYVESIAKGDETVILSAGMAVRDDATSIGLLPAPGPASATTGDDSGEVDLMWPRLPGAASFIIQYATDPNAPDGDWKFGTTSTKSSATVTGLAAGTRYWFRVAATGTAGQSPWSSPVTARAI
jgi:hypothetical protein